MAARSRKHGARLALIVAAIIGVAATVATAATVSTKSKTSALPGDATTHLVSAKCPKGERSTGGGIRLGDDLNDYAQGTYPDGKRGWTAAAYNDTPPDTEFTVFARCIDAGKVTTKTKSADTDGVTSQAVVARCPRGSAVVGGGVEIDDDDVLEVAGSHPKGKRGWRAVARPTGVGTVTATARCLEGGNAVHRQKSIEMPDDDQTHEVTARCPRKTKVTGGGLELSDPETNYMQGTYPRSRRAWTAAGFDDGTVTAHALCLKKD